MIEATQRLIALTTQEWSMEQAAEQTRWTYEDALSWIAGNFRWNGGRIKATPGYEPTENDRSAIRYLCGEHGFEWREL